MVACSWINHQPLSLPLNVYTSLPLSTVMMIREREAMGFKREEIEAYIGRVMEGERTTTTTKIKLKIKTLTQMPALTQRKL